MSEHHCYQKKKNKKTIVLYAWVFFTYKVWISNCFEGLVVVAFLLQLILLWNDQDGKILLNKLAANPRVARDNYFYGGFIKKKITI